MLSRKLTAVGLVALVLGCTGTLQAVSFAPAWDRKKAPAEPNDEGLLPDLSPDRSLENGDGPADLFVLKPKPVPKVPVAYQPPPKPQPKPRPKPTTPGTVDDGGSGSSPAPTPPITRPT